VEAPGATDSEVLGLLWLHCSARRCTASESGVGDGGYAAVRCISTDQRVKGRSCMQCCNVSVSASPHSNQRWLHDKDVLPLSLQQQSFYLLNRCLGTGETEAETGKVFPLHQQVSRCLHSPTPPDTPRLHIVENLSSTPSTPLLCTLHRCSPDSRCTALPLRQLLRPQGGLRPCTHQKLRPLERTLRRILDYYRRDFFEIDVLESAQKGSKPPDRSIC
jgi:hypothetical protein